MRKGFTLIEIVIVIVIIAVLMTVTMQLSSGRIDLLKHQNNKEQFIADYEKLYTQTLTSNYHHGERFETMNIKLDENADQIGYFFDEKEIKYTDSKTNLVISGLWLDGRENKEITLTLEPYILGCNIQGTDIGNILHFEIIVDMQKTYCFEIKKETCKLIEISCDKK